MEASDTTTPTTFPSLSSSSPGIPCAACKILRRRCMERCMLAPYFPPNEPLNFANAHRVFGASNIIKLLQGLPESRRADAVSSLVYEANARLRDPVYGCAGAVSQLLRQVSELQSLLARAQAELATLKTQHSNLLSIASSCCCCCCMEMPRSRQPARRYSSGNFDASDPDFFQSDASMLDDYSLQGDIWGPGSLMDVTAFDLE